MRLTHHTEVHVGVLAVACGTVLRDYFAERRAQQCTERAVGAAANAEGAMVEGLRLPTWSTRVSRPTKASYRWPRPWLASRAGIERTRS